MEAKKEGVSDTGPPFSYSQPTDAQRMRDLLARLGESQRAASRLLGVTDRTLRYWCSGQETPPNMAFLALERLIDMRRTTHDVSPGAKP